MLVVTVWRRHSAQCPHRKNRAYRKCKCRVWLEWWENGERKRKSAKTRSWEQGEKIARAMEQAAEQAALGEEPPVEAVTVEKAVESFLSAKKGEGVDPDTIQKHRRTTDLLHGYCQRQNHWVGSQVSSFAAPRRCRYMNVYTIKPVPYRNDVDGAVRILSCNRRNVAAIQQLPDRSV